MKWHGWQGEVGIESCPRRVKTCQGFYLGGLFFYEMVGPADFDLRFATFRVWYAALWHGNVPLCVHPLQCAPLFRTLTVVLTFMAA